MNLILLFESDFADGSRTFVRLSGRRLQHAVSVLKISAGDEIRVGLLNGKSGIGKVAGVSDESLEMNVALTEEAPPALPLTLLIALPRPKALRRCIEAVAAMGVKKVFIIQSWRVEKSYWSSPALSEKSLREHCLLGLEQGCDTMLPDIQIRKLFKPFVRDELPAVAKDTRMLVAHPHAARECPRAVSGPVTLAIGPEGGFIPYELEALEKAGFEAVSLGRRILRVEHALPAIIGRLL